jgi:protein-disulfide isomerase
MEKNRIELDAWVEGKLNALDAGAWRPDEARAWAILRRRRRSGWIGVVSAAMAACLVLFTLSEPRACANPVECANEEQPAAAPAKPLLTNFRESGNPASKVTVEVYSDYQCPSCAYAFTSGVIPQFVNEYVKTGRVRFIHRDFPLPGHQYSRLATRYANAAGRLGFYDAAVDHLFRTQTIWEKDGSIDAQMVKLLPPGAMQKVRQMVQSDGASLDALADADVALGQKDKINQTPSIVFMANGKRQFIVPVPNYPLLKSYLDQLLK